VTASLQGLTPDQQLQARNLANQIFGKRGGLLPGNVTSVANMMRRGMTANDIADNLRYAGQSEQMKGSVRDATENISVGMTAADRDAFVNNVDRNLQSGNRSGVLDTISTTAIKQLPTAEQTQARGKDRTVQFLNEIKGDLKTFKDKGGDTGIFNGTAENIAKAVGATVDPDLRAIGTKVQLAIQNYRRGMTGLAFTEEETKEYESVFPDITKNFVYNETTLKALKDSFIGDLDYTFGSIMGRGAYRSLYGTAGASALNTAEGYGTAGTAGNNFTSSDGSTFNLNL